MFQTVVNIGCFVLQVTGKTSYYFAVQQFDISLALDSIPACTVIIKDTTNTTVNIVQSKVKQIKYSKIKKAYDLVIQAQKKRQLLNVNLIQYKQDLSTKVWFKGKLCTVSMNAKGSIEQSTRGIICNCMHSICQLQYNYLTQSVYTPGTSAINFDQARRLFNYAIQSITPIEGWGDIQKDINSIIAQSNPNIKTDSILSITQKDCKRNLY